MESFDPFVRDNLEMVLNAPVRKLSAETRYTMVIVEPRCHANFEFVCKVMLRFTGPHWGLQVFHGTQNLSFVQEKLSGLEHVKYTSLDKPNLTIEDYNDLLTSKWFYEQIPTNDFVIFQTDSCLLQEGIDRFVGYDYIGAPWVHRNRQVGNGGFSLRTKTFCLNVCSRFTRPRGMNEDVFFATLAKEVHGNVADYETACAFSCESTPTNTWPLATHKAPHNIKLNLNKEFRKKVELY